MNDSGLKLSIYSRPECCLCDEMLEGLKSWQEKYRFKVNIIDIDQDSSLTARFAARIPVLAAGDIEICEYFLDEKALSDFFSDTD